MQKKYLLLITFVQCTFLLHAQNLKWNPQIKVADRIYQTYLGSDGTLHYSIGSNIQMTQSEADSMMPAPQWKKLKISLFRYDNKFLLKDTMLIRFGYFPKTFFGSNMADLKIRMFYTRSTSDGLSLQADLFDLTGKFIETKILSGISGLADFQSKNYFNVCFSDSKKITTCVSKDTVTCYDEKFNLVWKTEIKSDKVISSVCTEEKHFYGLVLVGKYLMVMHITDSGKMASKKLTLTKVENANYVLKLNKNNVYVASLYGVTDRTMNLEYDKASTTPRFRSNGLQVNIFDTSLENEKINYHNYSEQTLLDAVDRTLIQNIKGIDWAKLIQVDFTTDDELVALLEKKYFEPTPPAPIAGSRIELPGHISQCKELIIIKANNDGRNKQSVVKRLAKGEQMYDYVFEVCGIPNKTDYYLYYQDGRDETEYKMNEVVFNNELRKFYSKEINLIENKKPFLDLSTVKRVDPSTYIVFGRINKKIASGILDFK